MMGRIVSQRRPIVKRRRVLRTAEQPAKRWTLCGSGMPRPSMHDEERPPVVARKRHAAPRPPRDPALNPLADPPDASAAARTQ